MAKGIELAVIVICVWLFMELVAGMTSRPISWLVGLAVVAFVLLDNESLRKRVGKNDES